MKAKRNYEKQRQTLPLIVLLMIVATTITKDVLPYHFNCDWPVHFIYKACNTTHQKKFFDTKTGVQLIKYTMMKNFSVQK